MDPFDYGAEAELFPIRSETSRRRLVGYKRFARAADAIRFAIEELPGDSLTGAWLEVGEERFDAQEMRGLYEHMDYPLPRRDAASKAKPAPIAVPGGRRTVSWTR
jgi:hypothetical protein